MTYQSKTDHGEKRAVSDFCRPIRGEFPVKQPEPPCQRQFGDIAVHTEKVTEKLTVRKFI